MTSPLLIDITRLLGRAMRARGPTGVDRVCQAYVRRYGSRAQAVVHWHGWRRILPHAASQHLFDLALGGWPCRPARVLGTVARACVPPWPEQDGIGRFYLNPGHDGAVDASLHQWLSRTRQRPIHMVHDLIPITHPEYCRRGEAARHSSRLRSVLRSAAGVLTNSRHTAETLARFARWQGLRLPPVRPVPPGPAPLPAPAAASPLHVPYFVMLGTIEARKNHGLLLQLWRSLAAELGPAAPHLVVIGRRGWECESAIDLLERSPPLQGVVHELDDCPDSDLATWLAHARALLFPSFAEGFGLPLVEALALGTPVLASDLPAFRETAGLVPDYFDPLDGPGWRQAILRYAFGQCGAREAQVARMRDFRCPTWEDHFAQVDEFLEQLG